MMRRTRFPKPKEIKKVNKSLAPIVSDFLRVGMWPISKPENSIIDPDTGIAKNIYSYGSGDRAGKVIVFGELNEHDRGVFLIIQKMIQENSFKPIKGIVTDLVKRKNIENPYHPNSYNPVWDSVERLLDVKIRIKPNRRGGTLSVGFNLLSGWIDSSGEFFLTNEDYRKVMESLQLREVGIVLPEYFKLKSPIARSIKVFLQNQDALYMKKGYEIRLSKLCKQINYHPKITNWFYIRGHIKNAIDDLIKEKFLDKKTKIDTTRYKTDGGVITFFSTKQEKEKTTPKTTKSQSYECPCSYMGWKFGESYSNRAGCQDNCQEDFYKTYVACRNQFYKDKKKGDNIKNNGKNDNL